MSNRNSTIVLATLIINNIASAALNDTGIKTCSNATQNGLPCPVAGFPGQDAEYGTNSFNYTKLDANGNALPVTATNHVCVKDNVTGLVWEVKTDDGGLRDKDNIYTFDQATTFAAQVNATNLCGHNDWRVPNPHELVSLVDYSINYPGPTIDTDYFPNTVSYFYWTSSAYAFDSSISWIVTFYYGFFSLDHRSSSNAVRLVRGGQWLFSFTDKGDGTIKDNNTNLVWAKCSQGQTFANGSCSGSATSLTWQQALQAADSLTLAGQSDWRLPNVKELQSLVDYTKYNPSISINYFPNTDVSNYYWTSSTDVHSDFNPWFVRFSFGGLDYDGRGYGSVVRLVRAGPVTFSLNVTQTGGGTGTITSTPTGINCGDACNTNFTSGTAVTLTATPQTIYCIMAPCPINTWGGWGGACSGSTSNTCTVTMDADKSVTATFNFIDAPTVTTLAATNLTQTSAKLNGTVTSSGATANVSFDFGTTTAYSQTVAATPAQVYSSTAVPVSAIKTGLTCNMLYHYRVTATNSVGTRYGADTSFTTAACPITNGNVWLNPPTPIVIVERPFQLNVIANSNSTKIGSYDFVIKYETSKLAIDYVTSALQCAKEAVCPGSDGWDNYLIVIATTLENGINYGTIRIKGSSATGAGPGTSLQLLKIYFKTQLTTGNTVVNLMVNELESTAFNPIGVQNSAGGAATIKISPGLCGDADGNNAVNIVDALAIARKQVGLPPPPTVNVELANVKASDGLNITDAMLIARYSVGLVIPPEVCTIGQAL